MKKLFFLLIVSLFLGASYLGVLYQVAPIDMKSSTCDNLIGLYKSLRNGTDPNRIYSSGGDYTTPLVVVLQNDACPKMMPSLWAWLLISYGADVNLADSSNYTPLMSAVSNDSYLSVVLLISHGAKTDIKSANGETALSIAINLNRKSIRELLESYEN